MKRREDASGSRFYAHPETGVELPSVTTVLGVLPKPWMGPWAAKVERELCIATAHDVYESLEEYVELEEFKEQLDAAIPHKKAHTTIAKDAANIGTESHALIEWRIRGQLGLDRGEEPVVSEEARLSVAGFEDWKQETKFTPASTEHRLYSDELQAAGTADTICCSMEVCAAHPLGCGAEDVHILAPKKWKIAALGDWKRSKAIYPEHHVQVAVYRHMAIERGLLDENSWAVILRLPRLPKDKFEAVMLPPSECKPLVEIFKAARVIWAWGRK